MTHDIEAMKRPHYVRICLYIGKGLRGINTFAYVLVYGKENGFTRCHGKREPGLVCTR